MVCDALTDFEPNGAFDETIESAQHKMGEVNDHLLRIAERSVFTNGCGSTVVVLLARGVRAAVLWAGDSRAYRWRSGQLQRLSQDHSLVAETDSPIPESIAESIANVITRAVGLEQGLTLDVYRDTVQPSDRFLLCSDGLTKVVPEAQISKWMGEGDPQAAVEGLIRTTLEAGAPDNVTVLVVEAY
jgi:serine/threonine protein phosphatase PrpC